MMSRLFGRRAQVAGPMKAVNDLVTDPAKSVAYSAQDAAAVDRVELRIGQLANFIAKLSHLCLPFVSGGASPLMHERRSEMKNRSFAE